MENLSIHDGPPPLGAGQGPAMPPVPQLPPQMFTTAAQLLDLTDSEPALNPRPTYRSSTVSAQTLTEGAMLRSQRSCWFHYEMDGS